jgi:hypothetical protein
MKSIHAISTILAVWGIGSSGAMANPLSGPARRGRLDDKSTESVRQTDDRPMPGQSALGMPNLLAAALLQGASRTDRRRR